MGTLPVVLGHEGVSDSAQCLLPLFQSDSHEDMSIRGLAHFFVPEAPAFPQASISPVYRSNQNLGHPALPSTGCGSVVSALSSSICRVGT